MGLVTDADLISRLPYTPDPDIARMIPGAIEDISELAKFHGSQTWTSSTVPPLAKVIVFRALLRYFRNPEYLQQSRMADETLMFHRGATEGELEFTEDEQAQLANMAKVYEDDLISVPTYAHTRRAAKLTDPWLDDPFGWVS